MLIKAGAEIEIRDKKGRTPLMLASRDNENEKIEEIKSIVVKLGGYLTIIKNSENFTSDIDLFTINNTRLLLSKKIKESFDPKNLLNPGKMYREV